MTSQALVQSKVAKGLRIAANNLGATTVQYRPTGLADPMGTAYATLMAAFGADAGFSFKAPPLWDKPTVFGLLDTTDIAAGDIFVTATETYFLARAEPFMPPVCILCNRTVAIGAGIGGIGQIPASPNGGACGLDGLQPAYGGGTGTGAAIASGWPASIIFKNKGSATGSPLPGSIKAAEFEMLLPAMPGAHLLPYNVVTTDLGDSYVISGVEASPYGFRCTMGVNQV